VSREGFLISHLRHVADDHHHRPAFFASPVALGNKVYSLRELVALAPGP
jgi:hypothetical protein